METYSLSARLFIFDEEGEPTVDPIEALEAVAAAGFRETELIAEGPEWEAPGPHDTKKYREAMERLAVFPHTIHTQYRKTNLGSVDEEIRRNSVDKIADAMRFLAELGGKTAVVHPTGSPGPGEPPYTVDNIGAVLDQSHRSVSELVKVAEETGIRLALENLRQQGVRVRTIDSTHELRAFVTDFPAEYVGICLDVGHAIISGFDPADQARIAAERLYALHIHDNNGENDRHWVPGRGIGRGAADWSSLGAALSDIGFDGARTLEINKRSMFTHHGATVAQVAAECAALRERWESVGMSSL